MRHSPFTTTGVEDIDKLIAEAKVLHPTHFAVFWALDATAKGLSGEGAAAAAEAAWSRVVALADQLPPKFHHEKVVYWDSLAQARVVAGDIKVRVLNKEREPARSFCLHGAGINQRVMC